MKSVDNEEETEQVVLELFMCVVVLYQGSSFREISDPKMFCHELTVERRVKKLQSIQQAKNGVDIVSEIRVKTHYATPIVYKGDRIATYFVKWLGKSTLGLSYGLALSEALIAPAMPNTTARAGGTDIFLEFATEDIMHLIKLPFSEYLCPYRCKKALIFASECDNPDYLTLGLLDTGFGAIIHHCRQL
ncbi:hypothetical protein H5410_020472 [Solanum commersonii]|uniref:Uncharacterized protein n=1 Tax=Solanum commersonii TaxID=4109 RepID=A0A9J5ZB90_SOLCO|nr:hypothetical protein H5410_020472 [Solanum commersonii]